LDTELNLGNHISKFYKSFSGTDTLAFIMMPGSSPVVIGSLTTISYSMYRNKKPVINIGRTNINGVTRGSRIFAGTMVFTLINQHWLKELQSQLDWLQGFKDLKVDELPLFDIMIVSANEYGNAVSMYIYGIDFTDEAQTISVEDLFTENVFSFVARDISNFKAWDKKAKATVKDSSNSKYDKYTKRVYVLESSNITLEEAIELERKQTLKELEAKAPQKKVYSLSRVLYQSTTRLMMGNDVAEIQTLLNQTRLFTLEINGVFDSQTDEAVRRYQSLIGDTIDGVVDDKLYNALKNQVQEVPVKLAVVVNKHGAMVYRNTSLHSDIVDTKEYREHINIHDFIVTDDGRWYETDTGYVIETDVYSSYYAGNVIEFPTIDYGASDAYVTLIQSALSTIYPDFNNITGTYDAETKKKIMQLQLENGYTATGIVDYNTWVLLHMLSGNNSIQMSNDNFVIEFDTPPGIYEMELSQVFKQIINFNAIMSCNNYLNVKATLICTYDNNTSEVYTKNTIIKDHTTMSLDEFNNAFVYNPKHGKAPYRIDYILYPYNKKSYKWTIMIKE